MALAAVSAGLAADLAAPGSASAGSTPNLGGTRRGECWTGGRSSSTRSDAPIVASPRLRKLAHAIYGAYAVRPMQYIGYLWPSLRERRAARNRGQGAWRLTPDSHAQTSLTPWPTQKIGCEGPSKAAEPGWVLVRLCPGSSG